MAEVRLQTRTFPVKQSYQDIATDIVPTLRSRGREAEELGQIPASTLQDLEALMDMVAPIEWGGGGASLADFLAVTRILAQGCPATAWGISFLIEHNGQLARCPAHLIEAIRQGRSYVPMAATQAGAGTATPVEGGYRLSGRWKYASAVCHSEWLWLAATEKGSGETLRLWMRVDDVKVERTWDMSGMRATGSHDIVCEDLFVPLEFVLHNDVARSGPEAGSIPYDVDFARFSTVAAVSLLLPSIAVGAAEGMLDMYRELVLAKRAPFSSEPLAQSGAAHLRYGRAVVLVSTAREALERGIREIYQSYERSGELDNSATIAVKLSAARATMAASDAIDTILRCSGSSVFALNNPMQRFRRDIDVLRTHVTLDEDWVLGSVGRSLLLDDSVFSLNKGFV